MTLNEVVRIHTRYLKSARIDADLNDPRSIEGFRATTAFGRTLKTVADHLRKAGHGAFTWTGPYGSGKSSLMIVLAAAIGPRGRARDRAEQILGAETAAAIRDAFRPGSAGWAIVPVIGARAPAHQLIWGALVSAKRVRDRGDACPPPEMVLDVIDRLAARKDHAGVVLVIDELGKILEDAAASLGDIHFLQELAERSARSECRLVVVGILHQAFAEYASRLGRQAQDEWTKVQGRFCDIPLALSGGEQIELIANAIHAERAPKNQEAAARAVAKILTQNRRDIPSGIAGQLQACWPLHPVVACLLGPISRRRFGQNQRSIFGFLNSFEPCGFQDFIAHAAKTSLYKPADLFDYLQANLEHAILASPDGHRWSSALDALERVSRNGANATHLALIKTIALIDLFRERSGLFASRELLGLVFDDVPPATLNSSLEALRTWSALAFREHIGSFTIYAGSDFDLQAALEEARAKRGPFHSDQLRKLANLRPIVAKRHYHDTGTLRWFDVDIVTSSELVNRAEAPVTSEAAGRFILVVPDDGSPLDGLSEAVREASSGMADSTVLGACVRGARLVQLSRELIELEHVRTQSPALRDDAVARREIDARTAAAAAELESEVQSAFADAQWFYRGAQKSAESFADLTRLASDLAKAQFPQCPRLRNELLNRNSPSSNAVAAQKALLKAMVIAHDKPQLGIEGFPAERGLYESLIAAPKLHRLRETWKIKEPSDADPCHLRPLWERTDALLREAKQQPITARAIYDVWAAAPFGVRSGLHPVLLIAYLLSRPGKYTFYLDGKLELALSDLLVDRLASDPATLSFRLFDASARTREFFAALRDYLSSADASVKKDSDATSLALALVNIVRSQPLYTLRTARLGKTATAVRNALRHASDPQVLLHEVLPETLVASGGAEGASASNTLSELVAALDEIRSFFSKAMQELAQILLAELGVGIAPGWQSRIQSRANRVRGVTGDLRLEAFAARLATFSGSEDQVESIASLAITKPPRDWVDHDFDRAIMEIAQLSQQFVRNEALARVRGRKGGQHAMAFVVGIDQSPSVTYREFQISDHDLPAARALAGRLKGIIHSEHLSAEIVLAALAELGSDVGSERRATKRVVNE